MLFEHGRALVIGVGDYAEPRLQNALPVQNGESLAEAEARTVYATLTNPKLGGYVPERAALLTGAQTTRQGILDTLERFAAETGQADTVVIYFCGHGGLNEDGEFCFSTSDAGLTHDRFKTGTAVGAHEFLDVVSKIQAQAFLIVLNTGFAEISNTGPSVQVPFGSPVPDEFRMTLLAMSKADAVITASHAEQSSWFDATQSISFFGKAVMDALQGNGVPRGMYIRLYDFYAAIFESVRDNLTKSGLVQEPVLAISENGQDFPVATNEGGKSGNLRGDKPTGEPRSVGVVERVPVIEIDPSLIDLPKGGIFIGGNLSPLPDSVPEDKRSVWDKLLTDYSKLWGNKTDWTEKTIGDKVLGDIDLDKFFGDELKGEKNTGHGGITIGGDNVSVGGDMVGGDKITLGDEVGDKITGDKTSVGDMTGNTGAAIGTGAKATVNINKQVNIYTSKQDNAADADKRGLARLVSETIRLDVASPAQVFVAETFALGVAVRQPDAPPLQIADLPQVSSEQGEIFRTEDAEIIDYRVEIDAPDFQVTQPVIYFRLKKNQNSTVKYFILKAGRAGKLPVIVSAFQEKFEVASARLTLEAFIQVVKPQADEFAIRAGLYADGGILHEQSIPVARKSAR